VDRFIVIYVKQYIYAMDSVVYSIHILYSVVYYGKQYMHKYVDIDRVKIMIGYVINYLYIPIDMDSVSTMESI
jgi:hypothetical protein